MTIPGAAGFALEYVRPSEDGGTRHRWIAFWNAPDGSPAYDGSGATIEDAMADLIRALGAEVDEQ